MASNKSCKCYTCDEKFTSLENLYAHIEEEHFDTIPVNFTVPRFYYYQKTGRTHGNCIMCKKPTNWNDSTNKYHRFCDDPKCKAKYREQFKKRMIKKYNKVSLLKDPEQQRKMLANRRISNVYTWKDGTKFNYTGSYELDFLNFLENVMGYESKDIFCPSPHNYSYTTPDGEEHFYFPDVYIESINTEIEIKDGGSNPNTHPGFAETTKMKEKLKDEVMTTQNAFNYAKITNKNNPLFVFFLEVLKNEWMNNGDKARKVYLVNDEITYSKK